MHARLIVKVVFLPHTLLYRINIGSNGQEFSRLRKTSVDAAWLEFSDGAAARINSGCSKMPDVSPAQPQQLFHPPALRLPRQPLCPGARRSAGKAAASEETRRYVPHFVRPFARRMDLGEWEIPSSASGLRKTFFNVEPLSAARTPHGNRCVSARRGRAGAMIESCVWQDRKGRRILDGQPRSSTFCKE